MKEVNRQGAKDAKQEGRREPSEEVDRFAYAVIGAAIEVHRCLGPGFLESVYEEALCVELQLRRIPFKRQLVVAVDFKGQLVGEGRLDLLVLLGVLGVLAVRPQKKGRPTRPQKLTKTSLTPEPQSSPL